MMVLWAAVFALQGSATPPADTGTYATPEVRRIVDRATELNRRVPAGLGEYTVKVESEISIGTLRREGQEAAFTIEQVASELHWNRSGEFEQHVIGYRAQQSGLTFATLGFFRDAWVVPSLYGNRIALLFGSDTGRSSGRRPRGADGRTIFAVHPFADDRERYYRYSGGDTVVTLTIQDRVVDIVRVRVEPRTDLQQVAVLFTGDVELDAERSHIVRMRGHFSRVGPRESRIPPFLTPQLKGIANVELVNSEVEQQWWLPAEQRFELQATAVVLAENRAIFRILTTFGPYTITPPAATVVVTDTMRALPHRLSLATNDSLGAFRGWLTDLGRATASVSARDFDDVAPDFLKTTGKPIVMPQGERLGDFIRGNRVEGPFTGAALTVRFRDAAPGLVMRAIGGYAWVERTARGRVIGEWRSGATMLGVRVGRGLDVTNDFRTPIDSGPSLSGLLSSLDLYDYVDRRSATAQFARRLGDRFGSEVRADVGIVDDRGSVARWPGVPPWIGERQAMRDNRGVAEGRYARTALTFDWRPDVSGEFLREGLGARLYYERGDGELDYQRIEGRVASRFNRGPLTVAMRTDAGIVVSDDPPPQQLFELGRTQGLPGYEYKEFAGTQAVLSRALVMWRLPLLESPVRVTRRFWLPAPTPSLAWSVQAGWTDAPSDAAQLAVAQLGFTCARPTDSSPDHPPPLPVCMPVSRTTDGWRASMGVGMRFFGGAVSWMAARSLDGRGWRGVFSIGGQL
jgi:hypothetical protein